MAPDVLLRKLLYLQKLLDDLAPYEKATLSDVEAEHYKLERLFELMVTTATDILFHTLAKRGVDPVSYRDAFRLAAQEELLPVELAERLQLAAGMRNVLVHMYETIDLTILHASIQPALRDFSEFVAIFNRRLNSERD